MADSKRKRSLHEAFGVVRPPEETRASAEAATGRDSTARPVGAPEGGRPARADEKLSEQPAPAKKRASSGSNGSGTRTPARRKPGEGQTGDTVITAKKAAARSGGRGRGASRVKKESVEEVVPGKGGKMVPAATPVNMTFTVSARERYLWTLELKRRGLTAVGVLRETMERMLAEGGED